MHSYRADVASVAPASRARRRLAALAALLAGVLLEALALPGTAGEAPHAHGLWVWKGPAILAAPQGAEQLRDFCRGQGITEVYVSLLSEGQVANAAELSRLIQSLHAGGVRVEALLSSTDADQPGRHRDVLLEHVRGIIRFNQQHPRERIDGIHLDIEPQQRPENKGAGNLRFLPGLLESYAAARALAAPARLTVNADIQNKLLKGSVAQRRQLLQSLPRLTLMLYELSGVDHGGSGAQQAQELARASRQYLDMAYAGLSGSGLATLTIGLRTQDYGERLPQVLQSLDAANATDARYRGWARHSYNDTLAR
jgi:hypothetical protein